VADSREVSSGQHGAEHWSAGKVMAMSRKIVDSNTIRVIENTFGVFEIPTEGIFCSQAGNVLFPTWEQSFSLNGNFDSSVVN
jgi:hypothetical protein